MIPGHEGVNGNEEVDKLAREWVYSERGEEDNVLSWGE